MGLQLEADEQKLRDAEAAMNGNRSGSPKGAPAGMRDSLTGPGSSGDDT